MKRMKKAVLLMMVLTMTGCTSAKPKDTSVQPEEQQSVTQATASAEENSNKTVFAAKADLGKLDEHPKRFQDQGWTIKKDGLYGYVDQNGETVVDCQYKNMQYFTSPNFSHIESCLNPVF